MLAKDNIQKVTEYSTLYDKIIPKDNFLRQVTENIDFEFVNKLLEKSYCKDFGRPAKEPEMMFKLMFLKRMYDLSDVALIERAKVDMSFKYFLNLMPEDKLVDASLLTKFRKLRINKDEILEEMLAEVVRQAIEKGIIKGKSIIMDATHSKSKGMKETPTQMLKRLSKALRKEMYIKEPELAKSFPEKPSEISTLEEEIEYTKKLLEGIKNDMSKTEDKQLQKKYNKVKELIENEKIKEIQSLVDEDAKLGYKSEENCFFGYKNHLAMTEERIIVAIEITTGEAPDGKYFAKLVEQSKANGINVEEVLGDTAYSGKENLEYSPEIAVISKLHPIISNGTDRTDEGFEFIKDAGTMRCKAGHLAIKKRLQEGKKGTNENQKMIYSFDIKKCKKCPFNEGCYTAGAESKTYSVTILCDTHKKQKEFQETKYFKTRLKERYMIEAKNSELKGAHGLDECKYLGLFGMKLQSYFSAFVVNVKRMLKLLKKNVVSIKA